MIRYLPIHPFFHPSRGRFRARAEERRSELRAELIVGTRVIYQGVPGEVAYVGPLPVGSAGEWLGLGMDFAI